MNYIEFNWKTMQQWAVEKTKLLVLPQQGIAKRAE